MSWKGNPGSQQDGQDPNITGGDDRIPGDVLLFLLGIC